MGGWTRIQDAGLSCPDWPGCYGYWFVPQTEQQLSVAQLKFPDTPVEQHKGWLEMVHRYLAACLGLLSLGLCIAIWRQQKWLKLRKSSLLLVVLIALQGWLGMLTVTLQLQPLVVVGHLLGGLLTLSLLVWLRFQAQGVELFWCPWLHRSLIGLSLVLLQIALGGWTSANYAGWSCGSGVGCEVTTVAQDFKLAFSPVLQSETSFLGGVLDYSARAAILQLHQGMAMLLVVYFSWQLWLARTSPLRNSLLCCWALLMLQASIGIASKVFALPDYLALAHHSGAVLLLLAALWQIKKVLCIQKRRWKLRYQRALIVGGNGR